MFVRGEKSHCAGWQHIFNIILYFLPIFCARSESSRPNPWVKCTDCTEILVVVHPEPYPNLDQKPTTPTTPTQRSAPLLHQVFRPQRLIPDLQSGNPLRPLSTFELLLQLDLFGFTSKTLLGLLTIPRLASSNLPSVPLPLMTCG